MLGKVVLTAEEANSVFEEVHCSHFGGHFGSEKTHSAIISWYYWPAMEEAFFSQSGKGTSQTCQDGTVGKLTGGNQYILTDQG